MASHRVPAGVTHALSGTLAAGDMLSIDGASGPRQSGGTGLVRGDAINAGTILLRPGTDGGAGGTLADSGELTNFGTIAVLGGLFLVTGSLGNSGAITLNGGTLIDAGVLTDNGSITSSVGATLAVSGLLLDSGSVAIAAGTGSAGGGGTMTVAPGATFEFGPGGQLDNSGAILNAGTIAVTGGGGSSMPGGGGDAGGAAGGTIANAGTFTNAPSGYLRLPGGRGSDGGGTGALFVNTGLLVNQGSIGLGGGALGAGPNLDDEGTLDNAGAIRIEGSDVHGSVGATLTVDGVLIDSGRITINQGADGYAGNYHGVLAINGVLQLAGGTIRSQGIIANSGTVQGAGTITGDVTSTGTIDATGGTLLLDGSVSDGTSRDGSGAAAAGTLRVESGATLRVSGTIGADQTARLAAGAVLRLSTAAAGIAIAAGGGGTLDLQGGGTAALNALDSHLTVTLAQGTDLMLGPIGFIDAVGSPDADRITAGGANQTLTGGLGTDTLTGAAATGDLFRDSAAGLTGDTIIDFAGSDAIDLTDIARAGASLDYQQQDGSGTLLVQNGGSSASITLAGTFGNGDFQLGPDGGTGVLVSLAAG